MESNETAPDGQVVDGTEPQPGGIGYHVMRLDSWALAKQFGTNSLPSHPQYLGGDQYWCFRGQVDASWGLRTTLEREGELHGSSPLSHMESESRILHEYRRRAHHYEGGQSTELNSVDYLALIQHHGGPTRLLDFTHSFYVACFFALESAHSDAAVWAVNLSKLRQAAARKEAWRDLQRPLLFSNWSLMRCIEALDRGRADLGVVPIEPYQMSERLAAQQGMFLFPLNSAVSFAGNLEWASELTPGSLAEHRIQCVYRDGDGIPIETLDHKVLKMVLPKAIRRAAMKELRQMNITSASLFPGLDGFARSLRWYLTP